MPEKPDLQLLLDKWQPILSVQDWEVTIQYARKWRLGPNRGGEIERIDGKKYAAIRVLDPGDYDPNCIVPLDTEYTVVHELVHLHFAVFDSLEDTKDMLYEQGVHKLARALVALDRK